MTDAAPPNGRTALVTGAARGLGLAIALRLLRDGFAVAAVDVDTDTLARRDDIAAEFGERFHRAAMDVSDRAAIERVTAAVAERWGSLDVLVNNAAINRGGQLFSTTDADWDAVIDVNLKGTFLCSAVAARYMRERRWGRIISLASIAVAGVSSGPLSYAASKAGIIGLSKVMANELGPDGITVNVIAPGVTRTEWVQEHLAPEALRDVAARNLLRRIGEPEDVAGAVAFLASDDAAYITGHVLSISGGAWMP